MNMQLLGPRFALLCLAIAASPAVADDFTVSGDVNARGQLVERNEENAATPLAGVDEDYEVQANLYSHWQISPYRILDTQFSVASRRSDLGNPRKGNRVSRANLSYEDGEGSIPFRAEAGDIYAQLSTRSLRRNLKGGFVDIQSEHAGVLQSVQVLAGIDASEWDTAGAADRYLGVSVLRESKAYGALVLGHVFSEDDKHVAEQRTSTIAWSKQWRWGAHSIDWETEWLHHLNSATDQARQSSGGAEAADINVRLWNAKTAIQLGYERSDEDFAPRGGSAGSGQRRIDANFAQRSPIGHWQFAIRRLDSFVYHSQDKSHELTCSTNPHQTMNINISAGQRKSVSPFIESSSDTILLNTSWQLAETQALLVSASWADNESLSGGFRDKDRRREWRLKWRSSGLLWNGRWSLSPQLALRSSDFASTTSRELVPAFTAGFRHSQHELQLNYGSHFKYIENIGVAVDDKFRDQRLSGRYSYSKDNIAWSVELGSFVANSNVGNKRSEDSILFSMNYRFDRGNTSAGTGGYSGRVLGPVDPVLALALLVGEGEFELAKDVVKAANPQSLLEGADRASFNGYFLPGEFEGQQLVIERSNGILDVVSLTIDLQALSARQIDRIFERTRGYLLSELGKPSRQQIGGSLSGTDLLKDIASGQTERALEWQIGSKQLRMGIPRSLSGELLLKIEVQRQFLTSLSDAWG